MPVTRGPNNDLWYHYSEVERMLENERSVFLDMIIAEADNVYKEGCKHGLTNFITEKYSYTIKCLQRCGENIKKRGAR